MYEWLGYYPDSRKLAELVAKLYLVFSQGGYGITEDLPTRQLFEPVLGYWLGGKWERAFCEVLLPGGTRPLHEDTDLPTLRRRYLVLATNPDAWVLYGGHWQRLTEGSIYMTRASPHQQQAAVNWGQESRIHLIVDTRI